MQGEGDQECQRSGVLTLRACGDQNSMNACLPERFEDHMPTGSAGSAHLTPVTLTHSSLNSPELRASPPCTAPLQASPGASSGAPLITALCGSAPYDGNAARHNIVQTRHFAVFDGLLHNNSRMLLDHARTRRRTRSAGARKQAGSDHRLRPENTAVSSSEVVAASRKQKEQQVRLECVFRGVKSEPCCEESSPGQQDPCLKEYSPEHQDLCFKESSLGQQGADSECLDDKNLPLWSFAPGLGAATAPKHALHQGCGSSPQIDLICNRAP